MDRVTSPVETYKIKAHLWPGRRIEREKTTTEGGKIDASRWKVCEGGGKN